VASISYVLNYVSGRATGDARWARSRSARSRTISSRGHPSCWGRAGPRRVSREP
jgi:hypothetical protein